MTKSIVQFGYRTNPPPEVREKRMPVVDCRVIPNPFGRADSTEGRKAIVRKNPWFEPLVAAAVNILDTTDVVYIGCGYGRDRSGAVADEVARRTGAVITRLCT